MRWSLCGLLLLCACRDECKNGVDPSRCDENVAVNCPSPGPDQIVPVRWRMEDCAERTCVLTPSGTALCALSATPAPACDGGSRSACESDTAFLYCAAGFATNRDSCLRCGPSDAGSFVVCEGGPASRCAGNSECIPDLRCGDAGRCVR